MAYLDSDLYLTSEYDSMSVDAILAEFKAETAARSAGIDARSDRVSGKKSAQARKTGGEHLSMPSKHRSKHSEPRRRSAVTDRGAQDASAYKEEPADLRSESAAAPVAPSASAPRPRPEEIFPAAPAAQPRPAAEIRPEKLAEAIMQKPADPIMQRPASPIFDSAPRRSARPSEAEVRDFLDAFKRGDFLNLTEQEVSNPPIQPDARFYMGGERPQTLQYNGVAVDTSADENYSAPSSGDFIASYAREDAENEDAPEQPSGAFGKLGSKLSGALGLRERGERSERVERTERTERSERTERTERSERSERTERSERSERTERSERSERSERGARPQPKRAPRDGNVRVEQTTLSSAYEAARDKAEDDARFESAFTDYSEGEYAVKKEFETPDYDDLYDEAANPGSFREFLFARMAAFFYSFRRVGSAGANTMEEDDEDLGREVSCARASKYYGSFIRSMRLRLRISGILLFVMAWISLGLPVPGMLKTTAVSNAVCLGLQLGIMMLGLDTLTTGVMNAVRGKIGSDTMAVLACIVTSIDAILAAKADFGSPHLALCLISSLSLAGEMVASVLHARAMRKALRVPAIGKRCFAVTGETDGATGEVTILKSVRPPLGFVRRSEQASPDEILFRKISLPLLAFSFLLALAIALLKKAFPDFLYILSVTLCPAVPFAAMCCYSLPFFLGSMRIFPSGAAIAGWSGMSDIGQSKNLIVTDRDLFPDGTVEIGTIRIFADEDPNVIISYAGSMMAAAGSCSAPCFGALMERNACRTRSIENFEYLAGGGMKGVIDGKIILCGSTDLMRLMNVRIPFRLVDKTSVLLAVDGTLCGIFNMKYTARPQVREALIDLMRSNRHPVFAIRDFNVTPEMLHVAFDVATDGYDFPPYIDRFEMSAATPSEDSQIAAIICREGLGPLVHTADTARSIYSATRINTLITALSAVGGVALAAVKLLGAGFVSISFLFLFMLFWAFAAAAISFFTRS